MHISEIAREKFAGKSMEIALLLLLILAVANAKPGKHVALEFHSEEIPRSKVFGGATTSADVEDDEEQLSHADNFMLYNFNNVREQFQAPPLTVDDSLQYKAVACANTLAGMNARDADFDRGLPSFKAYVCDPNSRSVQYFCFGDQDSTNEVDVARRCVKDWTVEERKRIKLTSWRSYQASSRHFTQVIWKGTKRVGCGISAKGNSERRKIMVCFFDPPGNVMIGESNMIFLDNIQPSSFQSPF